jgi:hypothetical protein
MTILRGRHLCFVLLLHFRLFASSSLLSGMWLYVVYVYVCFVAPVCGMSGLSSFRDPSTLNVNFYVLLFTVQLSIIFVNNQLDAQFFFTYVYFYSIYVSGSHVPIIGRINCTNTTSGICHSYCNFRLFTSFQSDIYHMSYLYN